jgi:hypothetical protein
LSSVAFVSVAIGWRDGVGRFEVAMASMLRRVTGVGSAVKGLRTAHRPA